MQRVLHRQTSGPDGFFRRNLVRPVAKQTSFAIKNRVSKVTQNVSRYLRRVMSGRLDGMNQPSESNGSTSALQDELTNFHRFAEGKLHTPGYESLEELLGLWRANHPLARKMSGEPSGAAKKPGAAKADLPTKKAVPYL
jgi:hypothetical protein